MLLKGHINYTIIMTKVDYTGNKKFELEKKSVKAAASRR